MTSNTEQKECSLLRAILGPRPDEPIAELIDIIYSWIVSYFQTSEKCPDQSQCQIECDGVFSKSDSSNRDNKTNEEKESVESKQRMHSVEKVLVELPKSVENENPKISTPEDKRSLNQKSPLVNDNQLPSISFQNQTSSKENSQFYIRNTKENFQSQLIPVPEEIQSPKSPPTPNKIPKPTSTQDNFLKTSFKERVDRKLHDLSGLLKQSRPSTIPIDTKYAIVKQVKYTDDSEVYQFVRYLKSYESKTKDYKEKGLKCFVQMPNGVIVPYEDIGDHQR